MEMAKDLARRIVLMFTQWDRWIHIVFLALAGLLSIQLNDGRYFVAAASGALAYSILWFKLVTSK